MSSVSDRPIIFYSSTRRCLITRHTGAERAAEGSAKFIGNDKVHRVGEDYFLVTNGHCPHCGTKNANGDPVCRPVRVSVLRSLVVPRGNRSGNQMRVKGNQKGKRKDFDAANIREIEPTSAKIAAEMRELTQRTEIEAWHGPFDHVDGEIRKLQLQEKSLPKEDVLKFRAEKQKEFISWLTWLGNEPVYARHICEHVIKFADFLFPPGNQKELESFDPLLRELRAQTVLHKSGRMKAKQQAKDARLRLARLARWGKT